MYVRNLVDRKTITIIPETTLKEAARAFRTANADGLPVVNASGVLVGIFTKTHLANAVLEADFDQMIVGDLMEKNVFVLRDSMTIKEAEQKNGIYFNHLIPVVDQENHPVGILNQSDLMRCLSEESSFLAGEVLAIIDSTCNGVIAINSDGIITLFNSAAERLTGIKAANAVGSDVDMVIPGSSLTRVLETGVGEINQQQVIGSCKIITNRSPIRKGNNILGAVAVFQDITELQAVATELETVKDLKSTLESVVESFFEGIVVVDNSGRIKMINQAYCDFLNVDPKDSVGKMVTEVIPNTRMHFVAQSHTAEIGEVQRIGENDVVVTRTPIIKDGEVNGAVGKVLFRDIKDLRLMANKLNKLQSELEYYKEELRKTFSGKYGFNLIVDKSEKMKWLKSIAKKAAGGNATVLLLGESGTGKELLANAIHNDSPRRNGPFIKINCAAIPENLLESELFGYEEGAFTGARKGGKPGKFELANGGTIFLDEIGDMTLSMQVKLLRVLQEKEIERVGGTKTSSVDVRVIAATNRNLEEMIEEGTFRQDLYYRLNIISLSIPPLRERYEDIPVLCEVLLQKINKLIHASIRGISPETKKLFMDYKWPGNVRELENVLERAVNLMDEGEELITPEHLPPTLKKTTRKVTVSSSSDIYSLVEDTERQAIFKALESTGGNRSKAAELLGIHRSGFYKRLEKYNIKWK